MVDQRAKISAIILLLNEVLSQVVVIRVLVNASKSESLASSSRVSTPFEKDVDNTNWSSFDVSSNG